MVSQKVLARFLKNLSVAWRPAPEKETIDVYHESLKKWNAPEEEWNRALSRMVASEERFPALVTIFKYLKEVKAPVAKDPRSAVQLFKLNGYETARYFKMPNIPAPPPGATDVRNIVLNPDIEHEERCSPEEGRIAFREGWIESGADPAKCDAMFAEITRKSDRREDKGFTQIADYDDSL